MLKEPEFSRLDSTIDKSVNFFVATPDGGKIETRFVQRYDDRFIVYISSMTGCDKACRFCHLTQNGETMATHLSREEMLAQARKVLSSSSYPLAKLVHFNFMARGEPLSNPTVDARLFKDLAKLAREFGLDARCKISTIMPTDLTSEDGRNLWDEDTPPVDIYYSLYKMDPNWRKRWIPKALPPEEALNWLVRFQKASSNRVILHWALIDGENSDQASAELAFSAARSAGLDFDFNLVRYNPANAKSAEAPELQITDFMETARRSVSNGRRARMVSRVGFDVAASCGMFLTSKAISGTPVNR